MYKRAGISLCGKYRYWLTRKWGDHMTLDCSSIMLNPSTADDKIDDPTIKRCIEFARSWGFGGIYVANLYAYRATEPKELKPLTPAERAGPSNDWYLHVALDNPLIICAWGGNRIDPVPSPLQHFGRSRLQCFGVTKSGEPLHPLYLPKDQPRISYSP